MWKVTAIALGCAFSAWGCGDSGAGGTDGGTSTTTTTTASSGATTSGTDTGVGTGTGPCHLLASDWAVEVVPVEDLPKHPRMVFGSGEPAIAWVRDSSLAERVMFSARAGGTWTHEPLRGSEPGMGVPGLTLDADGVPHVLYGWRHSLGGSMEMSIRRDGVWESVAFAGDRDSATSSLVTAPDGTVHGLFHQLWEMQEILPDGDGWTQAIVDDGTVPAGGGKASAGVGNDLQVDADGTLHASYADATRALYYNRKSGGSWERRTIVGSGADLELTALALDASGAVHVAYRGEDDEALMLATPEGDAWSVATLEAGNGGGRAAQLEIDAADVRHVAHFRSDTDDVRYANDAMGTFEFASIAADVAFASLALARDEDGAVWIAWGVEGHLCLARPG